MLPQAIVGRSELGFHARLIFRRMRIYIVGVCGTFMGGLARIAAELGHEVGGCDAAVYPPMSTQLESTGIRVDAGYDPAHLDGWDCFIIGNALSRGNPMIEELLRRRLPYISGPAWLAREVLVDRRVLAVAGTHGKTTTTAMLAWILEYAGLAPGFLIGGVPMDFDVSARAGGPQSEYFVIEADEYDTAFFDKRPKFMHYHPEVLVLNNLEFDHADIYDDLEAIKRQFHFLLRTVPGDGVVLYRADDPALRRVLDRGVWMPCESFAVGGDVNSADDNGWFAEQQDANCFRVFYQGQVQGDCRWSLLGAHNVANALVAIAAAHHVGVKVADALRALEAFRNVRRRLEVKGEVADIVVYDDFAHHPSAIRATLAAIASKASDGRVLAVFEPRSNTMKMGRHNAELVTAFTAADRVFCYRPTTLASAVDDALSGIQPTAQIFEDGEALLARLCHEAQPYDHVVFMSNGGFDDLPARLVKRLGEERA